MRTTLVAMGLVAGCGRGSKAPEPTSADAERGHAAVTRLKSTLVQRLGQAMSGGAPAALGVCSAEAPAIAASLSVDGVALGRATRKPRNPANLAAGWQAEALARFEADAAAGRPLAEQHYLRALPGDRVAYAEPLVIQPVCLTCHGADLAPEVATALAARYPEDRATGYQAGDLRGVVWAELPRAR